MTEVEVGGKRYEAEVIGHMRDPSWDDRESRDIHVKHMTHGEAVSIFHSGVQWNIIYTPDPFIGQDGQKVVPETEVYDNSEFEVAGPVIDNRDGSVVVKMGKPTDHELLEALRRKVGE